MDSYHSLQESVLKVVSKQGIISMKLEDVSHLKSWSNYTFINWEDKRILSAKTLGYYFELLDKQFFIRTHRSYCVNIEHINSVNFQARIITLKSGDKIPLARSRKKIVQGILGKEFSCK